jgi:hypothetical protein
MSLRIEERHLTDRPLRALVIAVLVVALFGAALILRASLTGDPSGHVDLSVVNRSKFPVQVRIVDDRGGEVAVGSTQAGNTLEAREVIDLGDQWTFVARYAGQEIWRSEPISDRELKASGNQVEIPAGAGASLTPPPTS